MNPEYLQALWTSVATIACYLTAATEMLLPDFDKMSPNGVDQAIVAYDELLRGDPEAANVFLRRGSAWMSKKELDKAVADFDAAVRLDPDSPNAWYFRGVAREEQKRIEQAIADFNEAIRLNPGFQLAYFHRGTVSALTRDWDGAIRDCDEAIRLGPNLAAAYGCRGRARQSKGDYAQAISDFNRAIRLGLKDAATYVSRGLAWASRRRLDEAIVDLSEAIRLNPNDAETYRHRAKVYDLQEESDKAIADLTEAIRLEPNSAVTYSNRGWLWHLQGESELAMSDFNDALKLDPRDARAHLRRANAWVSQENFGQALLDAQTADELDPRLVPNERMEELVKYVWRVTNQTLIDCNDENRGEARFAAAYRDRGVAYRALEDYENALNDLGEAIRLEPSSSIAHVVCGQVWLKKREWDNAIEEFDIAIALNPNAAATWNSRGTARAEKREWAKACDDFSEAIRLDPGDVRAFARRGAAWEAQQEWDRAIADYDRGTRGTAIYAHAPRRRWQDEKRVRSHTRPGDTSASTADFKTDSTYLHAIRKIAGSSNDELPRTFDKTAERPGAIFAEENSSKNADSQEDDESPTSPALDNLFSTVGANAHNAICLDPDYVMAYRNRAECWKVKREWTRALSDYQELIRLIPSDALAYRRIAWLKAACPDDNCRNGAEAVRYATDAIDRTHIADPDNLVILAAAYAELGDFEKAMEFQSQARELSTEAWAKELLVRQKHFEALEFQQAFEKRGSASHSENDHTVNAAIAACEQSRWMDAKLIESLADAYAATGQFSQAIASQEKAHALNVAARDKPLVDRLELYRAGKPCRVTP